MLTITKRATKTTTAFGARRGMRAYSSTERTSSTEAPPPLVPHFFVVCTG
ncbi:hypothetical protein ACVIN2_003209 [Bradyrhizobium sp. USDA 3650]